MIEDVQLAINKFVEQILDAEKAGHVTEHEVLTKLKESLEAKRKLQAHNTLSESDDVMQFLEELAELVIAGWLSEEEVIKRIKSATTKKE